MPQENEIEIPPIPATLNHALNDLLLHSQTRNLVITAWQMGNEYGYKTGYDIAYKKGIEFCTNLLDKKPGV